MFNIMGKKVILEKSKLVYDRPFTQSSFADEWDIATGDWSVEDDWLTGKIREDGAGIIYCRQTFSNDIMLDFVGRTVAPSSHDLNFTWYSAGWDYEKNDSAAAYIAGLNGWWTGKTGIEKYPECNVQATTSLLDFIPGKIYHIQAGTVGEYSFIFIDGKLALEMKDAEPGNLIKTGKIGFGCYCSNVQFKDLKVYEVYSEDLSLGYSPDF
jgi:hypothetical protein